MCFGCTHSSLITIIRFGPNVRYFRVNDVSMATFGIFQNNTCAATHRCRSNRSHIVERMQHISNTRWPIAWWIIISIGSLFARRARCASQVEEESGGKVSLNPAKPLIIFREHFLTLYMKSLFNFILYFSWPRKAMLSCDNGKPGYDVSSLLC